MSASPLPSRGVSRMQPPLAAATYAIITALVTVACIGATIGSAWARSVVPPHGTPIQTPLKGGAPIPPSITATTFSNPGAIPIADATAFGSVSAVGLGSPYPSTIAVSGLAGVTSKVTVTLTGLAHTYMGDLDVVLVSPTGQSLVLTAVNGAAQPPGAINLTFDDAGPALPGLSSPLATGTYHPTDGNLCADYLDCTPADQGYPAPGPAARPTATALATFNGFSPNGTWSLFAIDRGVGDIGTIGGGWSISIDTVTPHSILATAGAGGSISPSGVVSVTDGQSQTFTITRNACQTIADVVVDGVSRGPIASYTFTNIAASHTIAASFTLIHYAIRASAGTGGTISPTGTVTVGCDGTQTFTLNPDGCHMVANVVVDGVSRGPAPSYTFTHLSGNHTIAATFTQRTTSTTVAADVNPAMYGQKVSLTATVAAGATGTVAFYDGVTSLGTAPIDGSGNAGLSVTTLAIGKHELTAQYAGDGCFLGSTSAIYSEVVNQATSATSIDVEPPTSFCGDKVTLTAAVTPVGATGTVTFLDGATPVGTGIVDALGHATLSLTELPPGPHSLLASYGGDAHYFPSASSSVPHVVSPGPTQTVLAADANPSVCGQKVNLTATVTPAGATGTVTFLDGATPLGTSPVDALGSATLSTTFTGGLHSLVAQYSGDPCHAASTGPFDETVAPAPAAIVLTSDVNPSPCNGKVTLTAAVTPVGATGTVTFLEGAISLGSGIVDALGHATLSATFTSGKHELTAQYSGDACHATAASPLYSQVVIPAPTPVTLTSDVNPSLCNGKVGLSASVTPGATGTVSFLDGPTVLGTSFVDALGEADLSVTFGGGKHELIAQYSGDACHAAGVSPTYSQVVSPLPASAALTSDVNPAACGQKVTLTATVAPPGATGTVTFQDGVTPLGTSIVDPSGQATLSVTFTSGKHELIAIYSGDACNAQAPSPLYSEVVLPGPAPVSLTSDVNPSQCSGKVTLMATVPAGATGTVTFLDGATSLGTSLVDPLGHVTLSVTFTTGGHSLGAVYSGDACYAPSSSAPYVQTVFPGPSTVSVTTDVNPSVCNGKVNLTATLPAGASGQVTFYDGATPLGTGFVDPLGHATLSATFPEGKHELGATYTGDACYAPSTAAAYSQVVNGAPTTVDLTADVNPSLCPGKVNLTATVTPAAATGSVTFFDGPNPLGTGLVDAFGHATTSTSFTAGKHELTAQYSGDACYAPSASAAYSQVVSPGPSAVSLTSDVQPSQCGGKVNLTATVTPAGATGTVTFLEGATTLGAGLVDALGHATLSLTTLPVGTHSLIASYGGDGCAAASVSIPYSQEVDPTPSTTTLTSDVNPVDHLGKVNLLAHVDPVGTGGTITFFKGATPLGSAPVDGSGNASLSLTTLPVGVLTLTAKYSGDGCRGPSVSADYAQTVSPNDPPAVTIVAPDGGELLLVNSPTELQWVATDDHAVASVSLYVSRDHGLTYTPIALDIPNTGAYPWLVPLPGTNTGSGPVFSAVFRVVAKDAEGQTGENISDDFFAIQNTGLNAVDGALPLEFALAPPTPNPTGGSIHTEFALPRAARVRLSLIDLQGRELAVLADGEYAAGRYPTNWNGHAGSGSLRAGLYFLRFKTPERTFLRRVAVTR